MAAVTEPRNPFYVMMLIVGMIFVATVLAYAVVPMIEEKAKDAGQMPPPSPYRDALRVDGWKWVLGEVAVLVVLSLASMGLDRYRRFKLENAAPPDNQQTAPGDSPGTK